MCRAPEAAENGLRLDALGNLISITVLRALGRGGDTRTGGGGWPMARRTVLTSNFNRRAISFFGTPSTRCRWRTSTHWDILITSASSWLGRRDDRVSPPRLSPGERCFRVLRGSHFKWPRGPFPSCRYQDLPPPPALPTTQPLNCHGHVLAPLRRRGIGTSAAGAATVPASPNVENNSTHQLTTKMLRVYCSTKWLTAGHGYEIGHGPLG